MNQRGVEIEVETVHRGIWGIAQCQHCGKGKKLKKNCKEYVYSLVSAYLIYPCAALYKANVCLAMSVSMNWGYFFGFSIQCYVYVFRLGTDTIWFGWGKDCILAGCIWFKHGCSNVWSKNEQRSLMRNLQSLLLESKSWKCRLEQGSLLKIVQWFLAYKWWNSVLNGG